VRATGTTKILYMITGEGPMSEAVLSALGQFLTEKLILRMEVLDTRYPFQIMCRVREWLQVSVLCQQILAFQLSQRTFPSE